MRILHCCLAAFYIDDFGYQENILPRLHRDQGHDVEIVASTETYIDKSRIGYVAPSTYMSKDGLRVTRLAYHQRLPKRVAQKLRIYPGLTNELRRFRPDVIFVHDLQFLSASTIAAYARDTGVTVYIDTHTDCVNSGRSFVSRHVLHGLVYRYSARVLERVATRIYATLPLRAQFLGEVYGIAPEKIALLPFGVDDSRIDRSQRDVIRTEMREKLGLGRGEIVLITGGKIDLRKNIHSLIKIFCDGVDQGRIRRSKLIVFGKPSAEVAPLLQSYLGHASLRYVEWLAPADIHRYVWAADVGMFPGTHSVLWEEVIGLGLPCVFRRWHGIEHVDLGGNCQFLEGASDDELANCILAIDREPAALDRMRLVAQTRGPEVFSYVEIARRAIDPK